MEALPAGALTIPIVLVLIKQDVPTELSRREFLREESYK